MHVRRRADGCSPLLSDVGAWKIDENGRPIALLGLHAQKSLVLRDDAVHGRKAKARSFARLFGREERLENPIEDVLVHSNSRVAHGDPNVRARPPAYERTRLVLRQRYLVGSNLQVSALWQCVTRVDTEVRDDAFELTGIDEHLGNSGAQDHLKIDSVP